VSPACRQAGVRLEGFIVEVSRREEGDLHRLQLRGSPVDLSAGAFIAHCSLGVLMDLSTRHESPLRFRPRRQTPEWGLLWCFYGAFCCAFVAPA